MVDTVRTDAAILALLTSPLAEVLPDKIRQQSLRDTFVTLRAGRAWINTAWTAADISSSIQSGGRIHIAAGTYDISPLMTTSIITPSLVADNAFWLSGDGPEHTVLDGEYVNTDPTTGPLAFIAINATHAIFEGIKFKRITNVAAVADGTGRAGASSTIYRYEDWRANWLSKDIELIMFVNCAFEDCRRAFCSAMQNEGWLLKKFVFVNCHFNGGWGGVIMSGAGYQQLRILHNTFLNIDGTPAGFTTGGTPITNFSSRAVMVGMNRESASDAEFASNRDWQVARNHIHTVADARTHATTKPEVHGTDLRCANYVHCAYNYVAEVSSAEVDECEAYYHRDLWHQTSLYETAYNGGTKESSWTSKGNQRYAYVEGLHVSCDDTYRAVAGCGGIVFTGHHGIFKDCTLINVGRTDGTDRGVFTFNGGSQSNIWIETLQLIGCRTRHGIDIACTSITPGWMTITDSLIEIDVDSAGDPTSTASGIMKRSSADIHLTIDGVEFGNFRSPTHSDHRAIRLAAGAEGDVTIRNCKLRRQNLRNAGFTWTLSGSGTNEYYVASNGTGFYTTIFRPKRVFENDVAMASGTLGSLSAGQFAWGDNDTLGASTLYVRLSDSTDPDTKAEGYIRTSTFNQGIFLEGNWTGLRLDILDNDLRGPTEANALVDVANMPVLRSFGNINLGEAARTEAATDATPSVAGLSLLQVDHSAPTTITALDDGQAGQRVLVKFGSANTTVDFTGTTLKGNSGADWTPANGDAMECTFDGTNWYCRLVDATA